MRMNYVTGQIGNSFTAAIGAKVHPTGYTAAASDSLTTGYWLRLGAGNGQVPAAPTLEMRNGSNVSYVSGLFAGFGPDQWVKVRMDVIPVGGAQDIIRIYTGVGATGSETWTMEHEENVLSSSPHYVPWAQAGGGTVGWCVQSYNQSPTKAAYIDRFQVFMEDV